MLTLILTPIVLCYLALSVMSLVQAPRLLEGPPLGLHPATQVQREAVRRERRVRRACR